MLKSLSLVLSLATALSAQTLKTVQPDTGKVGSVLCVRGTELSKTNVDSVYLSDQSVDMLVRVLSQTDNSIEFRIPPSVKPGKFQLVIKTSGKEPRLLEQPFYVKVEEAPSELTAGSK